jgi:phosphomannomutase
LVDLCGAQSAKDLKVVYTPLHGTGLRTVENVFPAAGIGNLFIVEEQKSPDGSFPTVKSPNPEDPGAMAMAVWQSAGYGGLPVARSHQCAGRLVGHGASRDRRL